MAEFSKALERTILTPEGVPISVALGAKSERASAFFIDIVIQFTVITLISIGLFYSLGPTIGLGWTGAVIIFTFFVLRAFYFSFFELHWRGRTPGKRIVGLRVIDRHGGELKPVAILTRNFMREVEVFLPLTVLSATATTAGQYFTTLLLSIWVCIFAFLPLFNRDALRAGDLVAGTWVIREPKEVLIPDLAARPTKEADRAEKYAFTNEQLSIYGIKELQVLEDVLRHQSERATAMQAEVATRIQRKIGWDRSAIAGYSDKNFLSAFYTALRRKLESSLLLGRRKESKSDD